MMYLFSTCDVLAGYFLATCWVLPGTYSFIESLDSFFAIFIVRHNFLAVFYPAVDGKDNHWPGDDGAYDVHNPAGGCLVEFHFAVEFLNFFGSHLFFVHDVFFCVC
ncbi:MAG: hypothetical protein IKR33_02640 [Bacteroidales bacterium]|nr:hypothetical protein [Bacteroidales bacterium]